jgi:hypothetical protein
MKIEPTNPLAIRPPLCPDCLSLMRVIASMPDSTDATLWHVMFKCYCGRTTDQVTRSGFIETQAEQKG